MTKGGLKGESRIREFASREEEAEWFDTHDMADYWDEFKPVKMRFARSLTEPLTVPLDRETMRALKQHARAKGWPLVSLVHVWILERIEAETRTAPTPTPPPTSLLRAVVGEGAGERATAHPSPSPPAPSTRQP